MTGTYFNVVNLVLKFSSSVRIQRRKENKILFYSAEVESTVLAVSSALLHGYREANLSLTMQSDVLKPRGNIA
jgi:hypothetical protein